MSLQLSDDAGVESMIIINMETKLILILLITSVWADDSMSNETQRGDDEGNMENYDGNDAARSTINR